MSLQIWLPLNGDLRNLGLRGDYNIVSNNVTFVNTGKIGQCASFNGSNSRIYLSNVNLGNSWSYGCWINTPSSDSRGWEIVIILNNSGSDADSQLAFWVHQKENRFETLANTQYNSTVSYANYYSSWHHFFATFNGSILTTYIDGVVVNTKTITAAQYTGTNLTIGARCTNVAGTSFSNYFQGQLNDVRVYNHCCSLKEVKEIAKGLALHYKLDDGYTEASTFLTSEITNTAYNSQNSKYGYNETSNLAKTIGYFQGKTCVKISTITAGQSAQPYSYFSNLYTSDGTNAPAYKALSFDYYTTVPTTTWLNIYKLGNGTGTATWKTTNSDGVFTGTYTNSSNSIRVKPNEWNHVEVILHGTATSNAEWGYCINGPAHTSNPNYYFLYANIQLEQNDHTTAYGNLFHNNIVYDCSGYENNGIMIGAITIFNDTPRYTKSTGMNNVGTANHIEANPIGVSDNVFSISFWVKSAKSTDQVLMADPKMTIGTLNSLMYVAPSTAAGFSITNFKNNEWNHIVAIRNGSTYKLYINSIEETQNGASNYYAHSAAKMWLFNRSTNNNYAANTTMSDFRIYATALTLEQIQELYHTPHSIDRNGNVYMREVVEI